MSRDLDRRSSPGRRVARRGEPAAPRDAEILGASAGLEAGGPPPAQGAFVQRALEHLRGDDSRALGFAPTGPVAEYAADPHVQQTSSGAVVVHAQQLYRGIPIFEAAQAVRFDPNGRLQGSVGDAVPIEAEPSAAPRLRVEEAALIAAAYVAAPDEAESFDQFGQPLQMPAVDLTDFQPRVSATFADRPEQPTVLEAGPFGAATKASLIWFDLDGDLRLAWELILTLPDYADQYRVLVDAVNGNLLYCHQLVHYAARGAVYRVHGDNPRELSDFPLPLDAYDVPVSGNLPAGFPFPWVDGDTAEGNCAFAHLEESGPTVAGRLDRGVLTFSPARPMGQAQLVLNLFFYTSYMHDYFYLLGFRERDGNFQRDNFGAGGLPSDAVDARVYPNPVRGTATMTTHVDGTSPVLRMGPYPPTDRHTALDASVVFHEYAHGVTNRLIGGPLDVRALDAPQSQALSEAFSDYFACTVTRSEVVGAWVTGTPGGIRGAPYTSAYPAHFGQLGQGRFGEIHAAGEILCAALLEMNRAIGATLGVRLVLDALRLMPANPGFLDARDAILLALDHVAMAEGLAQGAWATAQRGIWRAFARFGMGAAAMPGSPHSLESDGADFNLPPAEAPLELTPAAPEARPATEATIRLGEPRDDLTQLPEITPAIERRLQRAGISSFVELAARTPAELAFIIRRAGLTAERIAESRLLERARALADQRAASLERDGLPEGPAARQRPTSFTVELTLGADNSVFKTRVAYVRSGAEEQWAGWNERRLLGFIAEHAALEQLTE
jgi:extracellular elastinolytic metalloproteinase